MISPASSSTSLVSTAALSILEAVILWLEMDSAKPNFLPSFLVIQGQTLFQDNSKNCFFLQVQTYKRLLFKTSTSEDNLLLKPQANISFHYISLKKKHFHPLPVMLTWLFGRFPRLYESALLFLRP